MPFGEIFLLHLYKMSCGNGIWKTQNGQFGACGKCTSTICASDGTWSCGANGDISLDLKGKNAKVCTSWTTQDSCEFKQKDLVALQASLQSSGCDGLWAAPLWITPQAQSWKPPQSKTGEIDVFERGCYKDDGYLLSFGGETTNVLEDAWKQKGKHGTATALTAYMTFDRKKDNIDVYLCPLKSNPIEVGPEAAGCTKTMNHAGYYRDTAGETHNGEDYLQLVSDVWNGCENLDCGQKPKLTSSECNFSVSNIKLQFTPEATASGSPFRNQNAVCDPLWHKG